MIVFTAEETKSPGAGAIKDVPLNLADWLGTDTISTAAVTIIPSGDVTVSSTATTATTVTAVVTGGTHNRRYIMKYAIATTGGRADIWYILLKVFNGA